MGFLDSYIECFREALTNPREYFERKASSDGFGFPLKFAAVTLVIAGILNSIRGAIFNSIGAVGSGTSPMFGGLMGAILPLIAMIGGFLMLFIWAGVIHLFVLLLGGENGYRETLASSEYGTVIQPIVAVASFIPIIGAFINFFIGIYGVYIQARALENFQDMSFGRALAAILIPTLILIGIVIAVVIVFSALLFGMIASQPEAFTGATTTP